MIGRQMMIRALHRIIEKAAYAGKGKIKKLYAILKEEGMFDKNKRIDYKKMAKKAKWILKRISTVFKHTESTVRTDVSNTKK